MATYTYLDMFQDCSSEKPEGWRYLVRHYVPIVRAMLSRHPGSPDIERTLVSLRSSELFKQPAPSTARQFVAALGEQLIPAAVGDPPFDLDQFTKALSSLTATERQFVWLETMAYSPEETGAAMNVSVSTVAGAREKADELLRAALDSWSQGMVACWGPQLRSLVSASAGEHCLPAHAYIDAMDGKMTWSRKRDYDHQLSQCWHCVDRFCRLREADYLINMHKPLSEQEATPLWERLGVAPKAKRWWAFK